MFSIRYRLRLLRSQIMLGRKFTAVYVRLLDAQLEQFERTHMRFPNGADLTAIIQVVMQSPELPEIGGIHGMCRKRKNRSHLCS